MKGKKYKKFRNRLNYYELNFGFHAPYNILLDGNFIARAHKIGLNLHKKFYSIFKKKVYLKTTKCVQHELNLLGSKFSEVQDEARRIRRAHCHHDMILHPSLCLMKHIGSQNKNQYIVATCDKKLIKELDKIPKVPIITFVSDNVVEVREPSYASRAIVEKKARNKLDPSAREKEVINRFNKELKESEIKKGIEKFRKNCNRLGVKIKKKAKGPNPLSCLKKGSKVRLGNKHKKKAFNRKVVDQVAGSAGKGAAISERGG